MYDNEEVDPYTNKAISEETYKNAKDVRDFFSIIARDKASTGSSFITIEDLDKRWEVMQQLKEKIEIN
ncbi:hypothetical protein AAG747_16485 [Rapidithrix thailandica]|uniref:Uncharacterized protein n=1 Tax=Rapidithrix thailandica TaxID=413964 RepID=A0AAW9RX81_9BACT